jgi:hypothetical protein
MSIRALTVTCVPSNTSCPTPVFLHFGGAVRLSTVALAFKPLICFCMGMVVLLEGSAHEGPNDQDAQHTGTSTADSSPHSSISCLDCHNTLHSLGLQAQQGFAEAAAFQISLVEVHSTPPPLYQLVKPFSAPCVTQ